MLIETFCQIPIPGSAVHYRRCSEVKTTVQTINQLTKARSTELRRLLSEAFIRFFYNCLQEIFKHWMESDTYTQHISNFINPKIPKIHLIFLQSLHDPALNPWRKVMQFWDQQKLIFIQWMRKLKYQLASQQQRNKFLCLCIWNIKLLCLTITSLLAANINWSHLL